MHDRTKRFLFLVNDRKCLVVAHGCVLRSTVHFVLIPRLIFSHEKKPWYNVNLTPLKVKQTSGWILKLELSFVVEL